MGDTEPTPQPNPSAELLARLLEHADDPKSIKQILTEHPALDAAGLRDAATARIEELNGKDAAAVTEDDLAAYDALGEVLTQVSAHVTTTSQNRRRIADASARVAEATAGLIDAADPLEGEALPEHPRPDPGIEGGEQPAAPDTPTETAAPAAPAAPETPTSAAETEVHEPDLVLASGDRRPVPLNAIPSDTTPPPGGLEDNRFVNDRFTILAAADIPGFSTGAQLDGLADVAKATIAKLSGLDRVGGASARTGIAVFQRDVPDEHRLNDHDWEALWAAGDETLLPGGSLVAAANLDNKALTAAGPPIAPGDAWCAPSERFYNFCEGAVIDGILPVPRRVFNRGGISYPKTPDFYKDVYTKFEKLDGQGKGAKPGSLEFYRTASKADMAVDKPCYEIGCPEWVDCRLDLMGLCLKAESLLQERAYPELVRWYVEQTLVAHAHHINAYIINEIEKCAKKVTLPQGSFNGATASVLSAIELNIEWTRNRYKLPLSSTLEVVAPHWLLSLLRADIAQRSGCCEPQGVTDEQIRAYFAMRGSIIHFVSDWQDVYGWTATGSEFGGGDNGHSAWPTKVRFLIYPAGSFIVGTADVITLDGVVDSQLLKKNQRIRLFTEEGIKVCCRCNKILSVEVEGLCPDGAVGPRTNSICSYTA